jgi:hypothetical protein
MVDANWPNGVDRLPGEVARLYVFEFGHKRGIARFAAAAGVSERRAKSLLRSEPRVVLRADELIASLRAFAELERKRAAANASVLGRGAPAQENRDGGIPGAAGGAADPSGNAAPVVGDHGVETPAPDIVDQALAGLNAIADRVLARGQRLLDPRGGGR